MDLKRSNSDDLIVPRATKKFAGWPSFSDKQISAVSEVLRSGRVNQWTGTHVREFEKEFAAHTGCKQAIAVANGTVSLELCLRALEIGPGDEVVVSPRTFVATASAVRWVGARPVFADIDPISGNLTPESIEAVLTEKTKAVIVVHIAGWPGDMPAILELTRSRGIRVVEDCAQAHDASIDNRPVGSWGDLGSFSFCQDKIITTGGEGGIITTNDDDLADKVWSMKDHGKSRDAVFNRQHPPGFRWLHEGEGTNARMTEMQAAIGRDALRHLTAWVGTRRSHAETYHRILEGAPGVELLTPSSNLRHAYYRYYLRVDASQLADGWNRDRIMTTLADAGYPCFSGSCSEIYLEKAFADIAQGIRLPQAQAWTQNALCLLTHPTLQTADVTAIGESLRRVLECAASPSHVRI